MYYSLNGFQINFLYVVSCVVICLFKANGGAREGEVCELRWEWEIPIPELNTSVFLVPGEIVKNDYDHLIVLNDVAKQIIEDVWVNTHKR